MKKVLLSKFLPLMLLGGLLLTGLHHLHTGG